MALGLMRGSIPMEEPQTLALRGPSPPNLCLLSGAQYTLVAMAMASQREVGRIGQELLPHLPPRQPRTPSHPRPPRPSGWAQEERDGKSEREEDRKNLKGREGGEGQRKIRGRWDVRSGGSRGHTGPLALWGEGVRSRGSSLLPPTRFSRAETAGGWGGGAGGGRGSCWGAGGGGDLGDGAGVGLPPAAPRTAMETALRHCSPGSRGPPAAARPPSPPLPSPPHPLPASLLPWSQPLLSRPRTGLCSWGLPQARVPEPSGQGAPR